MTGPAGPVGRQPTGDRWIVFVLVAAVGWTYLSGAWLQQATVAGRKPNSYYALLGEALLNGQTNLKLAPDPLLAQLANPYAGPQGASRPHDMSYYHGRFYLYYGITPALLVFVPIKALTGYYPTEASATALLGWAGFSLGAWWLCVVRRRLFRGTSPVWLGIILLVFGFGTPVLSLAHNPTFYAVPIAGGFFCLMAMLALTTLAMRSIRPEAQAAWLAAASLTAGLAVGSRPIYVLALGGLLPAAALLGRSLPAHWRRPRVRFWLAAVLPAAVVGLGLALYNYLRFDDPFDFGIRYSMATSDLRQAHLIGPEFIGKNLWNYLLQSAEWSRYAPFIFSGGRPVGMLVHFPLAIFAFAFPATLWSRWLRADPVWVVGGSLLLIASLSVLFTLCLFFGEVDRYLSDFAPAALLLAGAVLLAILNRPAPRHQILLPVLGSATALFTIANGLFLTLPSRGDAAHRFLLERALNFPAYLVERAVGQLQGPLAAEITLPHDRTGQREPIVSSQGVGGGGDILYLEYTDARHVRVGYFHLGAGGPLSEPLEVDYARAHHVEIWIGSLLPPPNHPAWGARSMEEIATARRHLEVRIDGHIALRSAAECYFTSPAMVRIGSNVIAGDVSAPRFTGKIEGQRRLGLDAANAKALTGSGPLRLKLSFPAHRPAGVSEPLLSIGAPGNGELLFVTYLPEGQIRFGLDTWSAGKVESEPIATDLAVPHLVEIELGSLYPAAMAGKSVSDMAELQSRFVLLLDGNSIIDTTRQFRRLSSHTVEPAFNSVRSSAATEMFTGTILTTEPVGHPLKNERTIAWGPLQLTVRFPSGRAGISEPLLTTGRSGAADIIYVVYADDRHVRFGFDHWGKGGTLSPPVELDYAATHRIEISLGSLFPAAASPAWAAHDQANRGRKLSVTEVRLDGSLVLTTDQLAAYRDRPGEIQVGENLIGASSCAERFMGKIISEVRLAW
jgi:hypothetical protein